MTPLSKAAALVAAAALLAQPVFAQGAPQSSPDRSSTQGFFLGGSFGSAAVAFESSDDAFSGVGASFFLGYGITRQIAITGQVAFATLTAGPDGYTGSGDALGHAEIAGRFSFASAQRAIVPYLELGVGTVGITSSLERTDDSGFYAEDDVLFTGRGVTGALGVAWYLSPQLALDFNLRVTPGKLQNVYIDGEKQSFQDDESFSTARLNLGLTWNP